MAWHGIRGHHDVVGRLRTALVRGRLASSFLFVGPEGIGKRTFALKFAQALLCQARPEESLDPCGACAGCIQAVAQTHPDLYLVAKPPDRSFLPLELLIGDKEHRMREGLCHDISLKPFMGGRKIAIIDDADFLNPEGANCLLKTLEEPPPRSVLILIGTSPARQLPTIRSRCQLIRFQPLPTDAVAQLLISQRLVESDQEAERLAAQSEGSLQRALELADRDLWDFRAQLFEQLAGPTFNSVRLAKAAWAFVQDAGKEAPPRRERFRQVLGFATEFYRQLLRQMAGSGAVGDEELRRCVRLAASGWSGDAATAADSLDRCLEATAQLNRNANQATLLECWLDDLAKTIATGRARRQ
jgi:DNA polymerase-3 subunit delta'